MELSELTAFFKKNMWTVIGGALFSTIWTTIIFAKKAPKALEDISNETKKFIDTAKIQVQDIIRAHKESTKSELTDMKTQINTIENNVNLIHKDVEGTKNHLKANTKAIDDLRNLIMEKFIK